MFAFLILFDAPFDPVGYGTLAGVFALAGFFLSVAIVFLGRLLWRFLRSRGKPDGGIPPKRHLVKIVRIWALLGLGMFAILCVGDLATRRQLRMRTAASTISTLRTLNTALVTYVATYNRGFPETLGKLGIPSSGQPDADHADLVDPILSGASEGGTPFSFVKAGYFFVYKPTRAAPGKISTYTITADPLERGKTGQRSFFTDQSAVIRANATRTATAGDPPI